MLQILFLLLSLPLIFSSSSFPSSSSSSISSMPLPLLPILIILPPPVLKNDDLFCFPFNLQGVAN